MHLFKRNFKLSEIDTIAAWVLQSMPKTWVLCFEGDLGAGKTTLIKAICKNLGVIDQVNSPTYSLLNVYETDQNHGFKHVIHIDLYRISGEEEAIRAGIEEYIYSGNCCLIEWPQKAPGMLPEHCLHVKLKTLNDDERSIELIST